jgi:tetratricopeptide (TPR) repeat protein
MKRLVIVGLLALAVATPRASSAQSDDDTLIAADDPSPQRWWQLGDALFAARRHREAIAAFERALQLGASEQADGAWRIARSYARSGDRKQAIRWLGRAVELGYDAREAVRQEPSFSAWSRARSTRSYPVARRWSGLT